MDGKRSNVGSWIVYMKPPPVIRTWNRNRRPVTSARSCGGSATHTQYTCTAELEYVCSLVVDAHAKTSQDCEISMTLQNMIQMFCHRRFGMRNLVDVRIGWYGRFKIPASATLISFTTLLHVVTSKLSLGSRATSHYRALRLRRNAHNLAWLAL